VMTKKNGNVLLSFIDPPLGGFAEILPEVMIFPEGLCPKGLLFVNDMLKQRQDKYNNYIVKREQESRINTSLLHFY
jgi:hypothetical protein